MHILSKQLCHPSVPSSHSAAPYLFRSFESVCLYFEHFADYIPVTFVVGFYVSRIIARRWTQWENIPIPDRYNKKIPSIIIHQLIITLL